MSGRQTRQPGIPRRLRGLTNSLRMIYSVFTGRDVQPAERRKAPKEDMPMQDVVVQQFPMLFHHY